MSMINNGCYFSKSDWTLHSPRRTRNREYLVKYKVIDRPFLSNWWIQSYSIPPVINEYEIMANLVCNASRN